MENKTPVVVVMGHVDHGKTTLLDYIRKTKLAEKEFGGITQKIGAYQVSIKGKKMTFIDTPGHAAFSKMRQMGGVAADIAIVVVALDDGVMPQTLEAINLAKTSEIPFIIALTKADLPSADINRVKKQLADNGVMLEGWGGDTVCAEVSAKTGKGVDELLEVVFLVLEMREKTENTSSANLKAIVIESRLDRKKGAVCSVIVRNGMMESGEIIYAQDGQKCKIKALTDFRGQEVEKALSGDPVELLGFKNAVKIGSTISNTPFEEDKTPTTPTEKTKDEKGKNLRAILKADTLGSLEAIESSLKILNEQETKVTIINLSTGFVNESDVLLASASKALILAFNVQVPREVKDLAEEQEVIIRSYRIIYELLEEVNGALEGLVELEEERIKGRGEIIAKFKLPKSGDIIAGCKVLNGRLKTKDKVEIWESLAMLKQAKSEKDSVIKPLHKAAIKSLRIERDEVNVAGKNNEVGVLLNPEFPEIKIGNVVEVL